MCTICEAGYKPVKRYPVQAYNHERGETVIMYVSESTMKKMEELAREAQLPWWKRVIRKIKRIFQRGINEILLYKKRFSANSSVPVSRTDKTRRGNP